MEASWRASSGGAGVADEREQGGADADLFKVPSGTMMVPLMKKGYGAFGGGVTLEKSKLDVSTSQAKVAAKIDLGGGGGKNGNKNRNGGGDSGDDGGDDDDYQGDDDDGDDGDDGFLRRIAVAELFDRETVEAVLAEWFRSIRDLPAGMKQALEMGLISSAQMARFMTVNCRPNLARAFSRLAPGSISRAFIGRVVGDPTFVFKAALEQAITIGAAVHWEVRHRGDKLKEEWDLALVNVLAQAACCGAVVWATAPSRTYGTTARFEWQMALQKLPNHVFDKSYPLREFSLRSRAGGLLYKAAQLSLVGVGVGAAAGAASAGLVRLKKQRDPRSQPSVSVPSVATSALGYGAFLGLSGNLRYQLLSGADRWMASHMNYTSLVIFGTTILRAVNNRLGEPSRLMLLGLDREVVPEAASSSAGGGQAYRRPSLAGKKSSRFPSFTLPSFSLPSNPFSSPSTKGERPPVGKSAPGSPAPPRPKRRSKRKLAAAQ